MTAVPVRAAAPPGWREAPAPAARWGRDPNGGDAQADAGGASTSATAAEFSISSGMGVRLALGTAVGATALLGLYWASRRFHTAHHIPAAYFERQRFLTGRVVAVNDGDGFRMVHTPFLGFFRSTAPDKLGSRRALTKHSISVRLSGVDAPECAHFGKPGQPYGEQAKQWLQKYLLGRRVTVRLHHRDQYGRAVASVWVWGKFPFLFADVSAALLRSGFATLYEGGNAAYSLPVTVLKAIEFEARRKKRGMWVQKAKNYVSPREHKALLRGDDISKGGRVL